MTEIAPTCHINDLPRKPAALKGCPECPWSESNRGREYITDLFTDEGYSQIWRSVAKDGEFFGCHMFDGDLVHVPPEGEAMGIKKSVDIGGRKECAGAVATIHQELQILMGYNDYESYIKDRPVGFSKKALSILQARANGELEPELRFNTSDSAETVSDPMERVVRPSWEWQLGRHGQTNVMITAEALGAPCTCKFCAEHANLHPAKTLTTVTGEQVQVDEELHGLLSAMNATGIRTTGSCINFSDGLDQFEPHRIPIFMKAPEGALNYRDVLMDKAAYIRMNNQDVPTQAFLQFAAKLPGVKVTEYHIMSQVVFPQERILQLTVLARNVKRAADKTRAKRAA
ncbi:hypothetical protein E7Z53_11550 [Kocuria salina]|uniref:hypothetical protein n=1 Tax=Kocuria salina TaxID=1929416 RepID=UPI001594215C|nr:hypothetical protein [Kocuria salina]NVC24067.1 hypothetical protein [Kocuria salina]